MIEEGLVAGKLALATGVFHLSPCNMNIFNME